MPMLKPKPDPVHRPALLLLTALLAAAIALPAHAAPAEPVPAPALKACDDFDEYVNGRWKAAIDLPASRARAGSFDTLSQNNNRLLEAALKELVADPARQTGPGLKLLAAS